MLKIRFLGEFSMAVDGQSLSDSLSLRARELLVRLILNSGVSVQRSALAGSLWPDSTPEQARTNLRREIHSLRRLDPLVADSIRTTRDSLGWTMPATAEFDLAVLESLLTTVQSPGLASAADLARSLFDADRGDLLPGFDQDWAQERRHRVHVALVAAIETLLAALQDNNHFEMAIRLAERLVELDGLNEAAYCRLMRLQISANDRVGAMKTGRACRTMLLAELGVGPGAELNALLRQAGESGVGPSQACDRIEVAGKSRLHAKAQLFEAWRRSDPDSQLVIIEGEPGIGKTRLANELVRQVREQKSICLEARAFAAEGQLPYAALRSWLAQEPLISTVSSLAKPDQQVLGHLVPVAAAQTGRMALVAPGVDPQLRHRLFDLLVRTFDRLPRPLLLVLDDLQWADPDSLEWIRHFFHASANQAICLVATLRTESVSSAGPVSEFVRELAANDQVRRVPLGLLGADETAALVEQTISSLVGGTSGRGISQQSVRLPDHAAIHRESGGNPLFVIELIKARLADQLPTSRLTVRMQGVINQRLSNLDETPRKILNLAAVVGRDFGSTLLEAASSMPVDEIIDGLEVLWQRHIINDTPDGNFIFAHDCLREAVYQHLSPVMRRHLHEQIARALIKTDQQHASGEIAVQFHRAGELLQAAHWFDNASLQARQVLAYARADEFARRGLALLDVKKAGNEYATVRLSLVLSLAIVANARGSSASEKNQARLEIERLLTHVRDDAIRFDALERLRLIYGNDNVPKALDLAQQLVVTSERLDSPVAILSARRSQGFSYFQLGRFDECVNTLMQSRALMRQDFESGRLDPLRSPHHCPISLGILAYVLWICGRMSESNDVYEEMLDLPFDHLHPHAMAFVRNFHLDNAKLRMDAARVEGHLAWFETINKHENLYIARLLERTNRAWLCSADGDLDGAIRLQQQAIQLGEKAAIAMYQPQRWADLASWQLSAGDAVSARQSVNSGLASADATAQPFWNSELNRLGAVAAGMLDEPPDSVLSGLALASEIAAEQSADVLSVRIATSSAQYQMQQGDLAAARAVIENASSRFAACSEYPEYARLIALGNERAA